MTAGDKHARGRGILAAAVAGAFEAAHSFAYQSRVDPWCVAFATVATFLELEALTPTFAFALRRRRSPVSSFVLSSAVAIGVGVVESFSGWLLQQRFGIPLLGGMRGLRPAIVLQIGAFDGLVGLGLWAMAVVVPFAVRDANARALEAQQLRTAAELARLRANLQPHFLLNTLNTIAGLVVLDPGEARNLVGALGDLLRDSLDETDEMQTLDAEVKWLQRYAQILETRHRGTIRFRWDIAEATRRVRVPRLLLQPLLENAVKHGALRRREGGEVAVKTTILPGHLRQLTCVVEDNGPGPGARAPRKGALGLELVTRRLALKYEGAAAFRLEVDQDCTRSIVTLPIEAPS